MKTKIDLLLTSLLSLKENGLRFKMLLKSGSYQIVISDTEIKNDTIEIKEKRKVGRPKKEDNTENDNSKK